MAGPRMRPARWLCGLAAAVALPGAALSALAAPPTARPPAPAAPTPAIALARGQAPLGRFEAAYGPLRGVLAREPRNVDALYYVAILGGVLAQSEDDRLLAAAPAS